MSKCLRITSVALMLVGLSVSVTAQTINCNSELCELPNGGVVLGDSSRTNNEVFLGIGWSFGEKTIPELTFGLRSVKTKSNGNSTGVGLDFTFPISNGITFDKVRLQAIDGHRDAQGLLGGGYSARSSSFLLTGGVQVPYLTAGVDYLFKGGFAPYVGINTLGRYKQPDVTTGGALSCSAGFALISATDATVAGGGDDLSSVTKDGQTCWQRNNA